MKNSWQTIGAILAILISVGSLSFNFVGDNATRTEQLANAKTKIEEHHKSIIELKKPNAILTQQITDMKKDMERRETQIKSLSDLKEASYRNQTELASVKQSIQNLSIGLDRVERTQSVSTKEQIKVVLTLESLVISNNKVADALMKLNGYESKQDISMARMDQRLSHLEEEEKDGDN